MNHDPASDPVDARLSALYRAHAAPAEQPSAAGDARILAVAREAVTRPAVPPVAPGWRSWLNASWFGPGLAFATIASLSVVVVALMPKEDIVVERALTAAPGTPPPAARPAAPITSAASPMPAPAPSAEAPAALSATSKSGAAQAADKQLKAKSTTAAPAMSESSVAQAPDRQPNPKLARTDESARPLPQPAAPTTTIAGAPAAAAAAAASFGNGLARRAEPARAPAPEVEQPNPFPGHSPPGPGGRADLAAAGPITARPPVAAPASPAPPAATVTAAAGAAGPAQRQEKSSLLSESTESRMTANQPVPEVRDAVPTYPNEAQPSIPLPSNMYTTPRAPARDAASGMAAAPPLRDPAEWIKAIQKLRTEGKPEQVTKELTEFRRQYPLYPLPDELKQLVK